MSSSVICVVIDKGVEFNHFNSNRTASYGKYVTNICFTIPLSSTLKIHTTFYICIKDDINHWRVEILYINKITSGDIWSSAIKK